MARIVCRFHLSLGEVNVAVWSMKDGGSILIHQIAPNATLDMGCPALYMQPEQATVDLDRLCCTLICCSRVGKCMSRHGIFRHTNDSRK